MVEQAIQRNGWTGLDDVLRYLPGSPFEKIDAKSAKAGKGASAAPNDPASKVVLVYFIGGVTYSEIAALRCLGKKKGFKFLFATTAIINGKRMLQSFIESP